MPYRIRQIRRRAANVARRTTLRLHDAWLGSYGEPPADFRLTRIIPESVQCPLTGADQTAVRYFLQHRFDLLGSGWVRVHPGMGCRGLEGIRFAPAATDVRSTAGRKADAPLAAMARQMLSPNYQRIDWQLDFRSGYRWSERTWYRDVRYGDVEGADVKVPWELSRMQHLPELALAYAGSRDERIVQEFRDQTCDWIAANPPRFGVNWVCTMDVGIRIANWLIAYDLLRAAGVRFDEQFDRLFATAVFDHAQHIATNLEWSETRRANHYLGNIAGLLFAAVYLPATSRTDAWLLFAIQELLAEAARQFRPDGGHFEGSSAYHRLCGEMLAVCAVFLVGLPQRRLGAALRASPRAMRYGPGLHAQTAGQIIENMADTGTVLSAGFYRTLLRAAELTRDLTRHDGSVPLIGDDDSGRFVRLGGWTDAGTVVQCRYRYRNLQSFEELPDDAPYPMQSGSSHQQWLAWAQAMLGRADLLDPDRIGTWSAPKTLADAIVQSSRERIALKAPDRRSVNATTVTENDAPLAVTHRRSGTYRCDSGSPLDDVSYIAYPDFGVYIARSRRMHLVIRCGRVGDGSGIHMHQDQLSFDLTIDGRDVATDPGAYTYTPLLRWRNAYRSAHAHCGPSSRGGADEVDPPPFSALTHINGRCVSFAGGKFVGRTTVNGGEVVRTISLHPDRVEIHDEYALRSPWEPASEDPFEPARRLPFSPAYGVRCA